MPHHNGDDDCEPVGRARIIGIIIGIIVGAAATLLAGYALGFFGGG